MKRVAISWDIGRYVKKAAEDAPNDLAVEIKGICHQQTSSRGRNAMEEDAPYNLAVERQGICPFRVAGSEPKLPFEVVPH